MGNLRKEVINLSKQHVVFSVDQETWKDFKAACAHYGISISGTLTKHIQNIVNDYRMQKRFKPPSIVEPKKRGKK